MADSSISVTTGTGVTFRTVKDPTPLMPNLASGGEASTAVGWKMTGKSAPMPVSRDFPFTSGPPRPRRAMPRRSCSPRPTS